MDNKSDKIPMFKISVGDDNNYLILPSLEAVKDELDDLFDGDLSWNVGTGYRIDVIEMTQSEFEALPEWDGF